METPKPMKRYQVILDDALIRALDKWRRKQPDIPSRSAAIRELVRRGLLEEKK